MMRRLLLLIAGILQRLTRLLNPASNTQTELSLCPGKRGERLPDGVVVLRLAIPSKDAPTKAEVGHFNLSSEDKQSELQSLTVYATELTSAEQARNLMGDKRDLYRLVLYFNVDDIRAVCLDGNVPIYPLDVVWDPDSRPSAEGHAGLTGLTRPERKRLRVMLAELPFRIDMLPE